MVGSELGFMGVVIGALYWQRKVVLSVWLVIMIMSEDQFMSDNGDNVGWYNGWSVCLVMLSIDSVQVAKIRLNVENDRSGSSGWKA